MTRASWDRVAPILDAALGLEGRDRDALLDRACAGDAALRREVDTLLGLEAQAAPFLERSALDEAAQTLRAALSPDARIGLQIGGYRIDALIGVGGMGEVYRARDLTLDRDVALKVLAHVDRPQERVHVEAEARAASRLNHPGIVTIHAVGEQDGLGFIAMELVQGATLRARLAGGALPVGEAVALGAQLAGALAAAHAEGLVHCDLKPENVMVTPAGLVKVLDFGIARREHAGSAREGVTGTAGYMSPEQADGQPALAASDHFSFGVMLYEMLTGVGPFARGTRGETLAALRGSSPPRVEEIRRDVPPALADIVARCLARRAEDRFRSTSDLVAALDVCRASLQPRRPSRREVMQHAAAALALVAAAGAGLWRYGPWTPRPRLLAVLPFRNASDRNEGEFLAAGLASTLIERLTLMPSLAVLPRSLVFNFRDTPRSAREVARELGAELVLAGSVTQEGGRLRVSARLEDVGTGLTLWAQSYERPAGELLLIEEQIASAIVDDGVRVPLSAEERRRVLRRPTSDPAAYELYLEAVHLCHQETESGYLEARELLREALRRDPLFGAGHVQMATTFAVMAADGLERPNDAWPESSRHVRRALDADPDLADAYACAASHEFLFHWDWDAAEAEWRRAMRRGGADVHPDLLLARALQRWALGRADEAVALAREARRLDPVSPLFAIREGDFLAHRGDLARAETCYRSALSADRDDPRALFGLAELCRRAGRLNEAVALRRRAHAAAGESEVASGPSARTPIAELERLDRRSARVRLDVLNARAAEGGYVSPLDVAREHARLGEREPAMTRLQAALADRSAGLVFLNVDRAWDAVRDDTRFDRVRQRVGLA